ncbi:hypothetical protein LCGC14_1102450 [marine sediment metagenome]|uniref:Uncharacterized protein n=1 Tax=marine sediment metagenome TaxID=412755 RepID=A0A0F9MDL3_9ZZZZ
MSARWRIIGTVGDVGSGRVTVAGRTLNEVRRALRKVEHLGKRWTLCTFDGGRIAEGVVRRSRIDGKPQLMG